jgi:hypothetical protein
MLLVAMVTWALALALTGSSDALLFLAPVTLIYVPLLVGRYLGEDAIAGLAQHFYPRAGRRVRSALRARPIPFAAHRTLARGALLYGESLASRPPPIPLLS